MAGDCVTVARVTADAHAIAAGAEAPLPATDRIVALDVLRGFALLGIFIMNMVVFDYTDRFPTAIAELAGYLKDGRIKSREDIVVGFDTFPEALLKLFRGENFGKLVLQVAEG